MAGRIKARRRIAGGRTGSPACSFCLFIRLIWIEPCGCLVGHAALATIDARQPDRPTDVVVIQDEVPISDDRAEELALLIKHGGADRCGGTGRISYRQHELSRFGCMDRARQHTAPSEPDVDGGRVETHIHGKALRIESELRFRVGRQGRDDCGAEWVGDGRSTRCADAQTLLVWDRHDGERFPDPAGCRAE